MNQTPTPQQTQAPLQPLLAQAMMCIADPIFITDDTGKIVWINDAFSRLSGYDSDEALGHTPAILQSGKQNPSFYAELWQTIRAGDVWQGEIVDRRKDGSYYTAEEIIAPLRNDQGAISHFIAVQHDITRRQQESERDRHLAYHDILTGLPNRVLLHEAQQKAISHARRTQQLLATMFLDLDGFKTVNDKLGHSTGDQLLVAVADRLRANIRQSDTIARFGGDEFAILVTGFEDISVPATLARKLIDALTHPFVLRGQKFSLSASIGIALYPADGNDPETLLVNADKAMYQAKVEGGRRWRFYDSASCNRMQERSGGDSP